MQITEEIEAHFDKSDPPSQEFLLEPIPTNLRSRIGQLLQKNLVADEPNEFETPEWEEDFESKASALRDAFHQTMPEELYSELFGSLGSKCHVLADERKKTAKSFYELESLIQGHDDVFLYTQKFDYIPKEATTGRNGSYSKTYSALSGIKCFVVDIDKVDASNIRAVIEMVMSKQILPNYINLTGNGLHLYFLYDAFHDMKHSAWLMAYVNGTDRAFELKVYAAIKQEMIKWFSGTTAEADVQNHLAQPSRLPGSKTKNRNKRTILFKVSDTKHSIQHIAEMFGIDLPDEERIRQWKKKVTADQRRWRKTQQDMASKPASLLDFFGTGEPEPMLEVTAVEDEVNVTSPNVDNPNSKYRFSFDGIRQRMIDENIMEQQSPEAQYYAEKKARAASPEAQKRKVAQRRGLESMYDQFRDYCHNVAQYRKRRQLLHIFWNHAPWYQHDMGVIQRDFDYLFLICNSLHHAEVTEEQYNSIVNGPHYPYTKDTISEIMGVKLKFKNKKKDKLQHNSDAKDNMWKRIYVICETALENNPHCSWEHILSTVNSYGIDVCDKTLRTRPEIKELKTRMRSQ